MCAYRRYWYPPDAGVAANGNYISPTAHRALFEELSARRKRFTTNDTTTRFRTREGWFPLGNMRRGGGGGGYNHNMHTHPQHHRGGGGGGGDRGSGSRNRAFAQNSQQAAQMVPYGSGSRPNSFPLPQQHFPQQLPVPVTSSQPSTNNYSPVTASSDMPPVETVVARLETACRLLHGIGGNNTRVNEISHEIQILSEDLRRVGPHLETSYPDVLDRVMSSMRDASSMPSLPPSLRLAIFELVELRAAKWMLPSDSSNYYRQRRNLNDPGDISEEGSPNSGHYPRATAAISKPEPMYNAINSPKTSPLPPNPVVGVANKTYREEILIKNSDSGKVMGVRGKRCHLIEALSDSIISFEKVAPTAKERVLSINGYSQQSINMAKQLIQETITRNASPVFDGLTIGDYNAEGDSDVEAVAHAIKKIHMNMTPGKLEDDGSQFNYSVTLGAEDVIKISGKNLQYVQEAKLALDDYFSQKYPDLFYSGNMAEDEVEMVQLAPRYDRATLLSLSVVEAAAPDFSHLDPDIRSTIVLQERRKFDHQQLINKKSKEESNAVEIVPG